MRVLILGINHQIQWAKIFSSSTTGELERFEQGQKDHFRELLRKKIAERGVQFIGEETKHGEPAIAHEVANSERRRYANIEMHPDVRAGRGIPANYENNPNVSAQMAQFNQQREDYMFEKAVAEAADAESIMVICGRYHSQALANKFRAAGHQVDEADIQGENWYIEDWMTHMMRM